MRFPILKRALNFLPCLIILINFAVAARAQAGTGTVEGVVTDVQGAVIPGANVVITTGSSSRSSETNRDGEFRVEVPAGTSRITVERMGFSRTKLNRVRVAAGASRSLKIVLKVKPTKLGKCPKGQICL